MACVSVCPTNTSSCSSSLSPNFSNPTALFVNSLLLLVVKPSWSSKYQKLEHTNLGPTLGSVTWKEGPSFLGSSWLKMWELKPAWDSSMSARSAVYCSRVSAIVRMPSSRHTRHIYPSPFSDFLQVCFILILSVGNGVECNSAFSALPLNECLDQRGACWSGSLEGWRRMWKMKEELSETIGQIIKMLESVTDWPCHGHSALQDSGEWRGMQGTREADSWWDQQCSLLLPYPETEEMPFARLLLKNSSPPLSWMFTVNIPPLFPLFSPLWKGVKEVPYVDSLCWHVSKRPCQLVLIVVTANFHSSWMLLHTSLAFNILGQSHIPVQFPRHGQDFNFQNLLLRHHNILPISVSAGGPAFAELSNGRWRLPVLGTYPSLGGEGPGTSSTPSFTLEAAEQHVHYGWAVFRNSAHYSSC